MFVNPPGFIEFSSSGWSDSTLKEEFIEWIGKQLRPGPGLFILDNHGSNIDISVIEKARRRSIELFTLPANSTHLLQPLDLLLFSSFKSHLTTAIHTFKQLHERIGIKTCPTSWELQCKAFDQFTIQRAWTLSNSFPPTDPFSITFFENQCAEQQPTGHPIRPVHSQAGEGRSAYHFQRAHVSFLLFCSVQWKLVHLKNSTFFRQEVPSSSC
jgi:hypothetical protein